MFCIGVIPMKTHDLSEICISEVTLYLRYPTKTIIS